jgi:hypothetical protein
LRHSGERSEQATNLAPIRVRRASASELDHKYEPDHEYGYLHTISTGRVLISDGLSVF